MKTIERNNMKKNYSRPMMEIEQLVGIQPLLVDSLKVFTANSEDNEVDNHDDLLSDETSLWDEMEDNLQ